MSSPGPTHSVQSVLRPTEREVIRRASDLSVPRLDFEPLPLVGDLHLKHSPAGHFAGPAIFRPRAGLSVVRQGGCWSKKWISWSDVHYPLPLLSPNQPV